MNKLLKDNSYSQPLLFEGAKTETKFTSQPTESKSEREHPDFVRAKHDRRKFISDNQRFTAVMLRPYEYICKTQMHPSDSCAQKLKPQDSGYTIIESLVAMIVVSVLMIAIAPVMAYSVAIRVQARRIELAAMAGRAYVDALRAGAIRPNDATSPVGFPTDNSAAPQNSSGLYCVDTDGGGCTGNKDFYIQGVRPINTGTTIPTDTGYNLIVRVYRADGFTGKPMTTTQQSVANSALGNPQAPLVVMQSQIPPTTGEASSYGSLCTRLKGDPEKCTN